MPLSALDFGENVITLTGTDAFFLDTNMLVAFLYDKHEKHLPCFSLISYLLKNDVILCVSEVVVVELINSLARTLYIADKYDEYIRINGEPTKKKDRKSLEHKFKISWSDTVIKREHEVLKRYNGLASTKIESFISGTLLIESNEYTIEDTLNIIKTTPLASADAMIVSTVLNFGCQYILSIDGDMSVADNVDVISTQIKNETFNSSDMLEKLDITNYLVQQIGEEVFKSKFPGVIIQVA